MMVQLWKERLGTRHRLGVGRAHDRTLLKQPLDDFQRRSEADVVGVGLKGQSEHRHVLAFHYP